jgi:DNA-binding NtrC family response regulator
MPGVEHEGSPEGGGGQRCVVDDHLNAGGRGAREDESHAGHDALERDDPRLGRLDRGGGVGASDADRRLVALERRRTLAQRLEARGNPIPDIGRILDPQYAAELVQRRVVSAIVFVGDPLGKRLARRGERVFVLGSCARRVEKRAGEAAQREGATRRATVDHGHERSGAAKNGAIAFRSCGAGPYPPCVKAHDRRGGTESSATPEAAPGSGPVLRLVAVEGPAVGRALALINASATVGRHPTNDLVLPDPRVSGVHVELRRAGGRVHVRDAGSTNGTWLGDHRVRDVELAPGGQITVGGTVLRVELDEAARAPAPGPRMAFGGLVGVSAAMRELFVLLERVAAKPLTLLIQGETGTGKEEAARAVHAHSPRAAGPFVVIDATSLPESLAESLLFGHEKGAFTGADRRRAGFFEAAAQGTVFIDEVGELPPALQPKFLRVLERGEVVRVGSHAPVKVDVRVLAATHRDLRHEIDAGRFREDLYYRLAQVRVVLPRLRDRPEDVPALCEALLSALGGGWHLEPAALEYLSVQPWPGNVRELRNALARAMALGQAGVIRREDLAGEGLGFRGTRAERDALDVSGPFANAKERAMHRFETAYLAALMKRCAGNVSLAAREAGLVRHHLRDLLKKRGLYRGVGDEGGSDDD